MFKKAICGLLSVLFIVFAFLQINDATQYGNHDAWIWIFLYGFMGGLSGWMAWKAVKVEILSAWAGFTWGCWLFKIQDYHGNLNFDWLVLSNYWTADNSQMVQQVNESGGLFILACCTLALFLLKSNSSSAQ